MIISIDEFRREEKNDNNNHSTKCSVLRDIIVLIISMEIKINLDEWSEFEMNLEMLFTVVCQPMRFT